MRVTTTVFVLLVCALVLSSAGSLMAQTVLRRASTPPTAPPGNLEFDDTVGQQMYWDYYFNGDYDQNGEVNISDVTVVGQKFNMNSSHINWPAARVADGDNNGEVNISDLTPIGVNFGSRVTHFRIYWADDEDGTFEPSEPWNPESYITTPFDSATIGPGGGPRPFEHYLTYPLEGKYYTVVAFDGDQPASTHSNVVLLDPANKPPHAGLAVDDALVTKTPGTIFFMHGGGSTDADGTIVNYEWDPLGNGIWITTGNVSEFSYQYDDEGEYTPALRVTDDGGATSTTSYLTPQVIIVP